jgi:hypothetical protein
MVTGGVQHKSAVLMSERRIMVTGSVRTKHVVIGSVRTKRCGYRRCKKKRNMVIGGVRTQTNGDSVRINSVMTGTNLW